MASWGPMVIISLAHSTLAKTGSPFKSSAKNYNRSLSRLFQGTVALPSPMQPSSLLSASSLTPSDKQCAYCGERRREHESDNKTPHPAWTCEFFVSRGDFRYTLASWKFKTDTWVQVSLISWYWGYIQEPQNICHVKKRPIVSVQWEKKTIEKRNGVVESVQEMKNTLGQTLLLPNSAGCFLPAGFYRRCCFLCSPNEFLFIHQASA